MRAVTCLTTRQNVRQLAMAVRELEGTRSALAEAVLAAHDDGVTRVELAGLLEIGVDEVDTLLGELLLQRVLRDAS